MKENKGIIFTGLGFELVGIVIASLYIGQKIDQLYGWGGLGVGSAILLGTMAWFYHLIILIRRFMDDD